MPEVAREKDTVKTGHDCTSETKIKDHSSDVFVNGRGAARKGDETEIHTIRVGKFCVPHTEKIHKGSGTVFVNGKELARKGDPADSGEISSGSGTVFAG